MFERTSTAEVTDIEQLQALSDRLECATPQEIVGWAIETYRDKLTIATAFGAEGCCLLAMIAQSRDETGFAPNIFNSAIVQPVPSIHFSGCRLAVNLSDGWNPWCQKEQILYTEFMH